MAPYLWRAYKASDEVAGYDVGGEYSRKFSFSRFMRKYGSIVSLLIAIVVIGGLIVGISYGLKSCQAETDPPVTTIELTPSPEPVATAIVPSTDTPSPTPEEEPFDYIDDLAITTRFEKNVFQPLGYKR